MNKISTVILVIAVSLLVSVANADISILQKEAENGSAEAQFNLAGIYAQGQEVLQDYVQSAKWCRKAAEQGLPAAQNNLGAMFDHGLGVNQDYSEAVNWYRKAAE